MTRVLCIYLRKELIHRIGAFVSITTLSFTGCCDANNIVGIFRQLTYLIEFYGAACMSLRRVIVFKYYLYVECCLDRFDEFTR